MWKILVVMLMALSLLPAMAEPLQVGGDYGRSWLTNFGDRSVVREPSGGLWSWGATPKGQFLSNGTLEPIGTSTIYYPAFTEEQRPLLINRTNNLNAGYFPQDFTSPYFMDDPWIIAQITGRPVVLRT